MAEKEVMKITGGLWLTVEARQGQRAFDLLLPRRDPIYHQAKKPQNARNDLAPSAVKVLAGLAEHYERTVLEHQEILAMSPGTWGSAIRILEAKGLVYGVRGKTPRGNYTKHYGLTEAGQLDLESRGLPVAKWINQTGDLKHEVYTKRVYKEMQPLSSEIWGDRWVGSPELGKRFDLAGIFKDGSGMWACEIICSGSVRLNSDALERGLKCGDGIVKLMAVFEEETLMKSVMKLFDACDEVKKRLTFHLVTEFYSREK